MEDRYNRRLVRYLKRCREAAGVTQKEIGGARLMTGNQYVSNIERYRCPISMDILACYIECTGAKKAQIIRLHLIYERDKMRKFFKGK